MNAKIAFFVSASLWNAALLFAGDKPDSADLRQAAVNEGRLLQMGHYSRWTLGPEMSERILETYFEDLDSDKVFYPR